MRHIDWALLARLVYTVSQKTSLMLSATAVSSVNILSVWWWQMSSEFRRKFRSRSAVKKCRKSVVVWLNYVRQRAGRFFAARSSLVGNEAAGDRSYAVAGTNAWILSPLSGCWRAEPRCAVAAVMLDSFVPDRTSAHLTSAVQRRPTDRPRSTPGLGRASAERFLSVGWVGCGGSVVRMRLYVRCDACQPGTRQSPSADISSICMLH